MRQLVFWIALSLACVSAQEPSKKFLAGAATSNITPPIGMPVVGGFSPSASTHVHDELHARCLVLDNGEKRVAIVVCDLLGAARQMYDEAARLVEAQTGIPRERLLMSATHTHSASSALSENRYSLDEPLSEYQTFVARRIADGVTRAVNNLVPARIGWGVGEEPDQVFNRRWFMKEGTVPPNPFGGIDKVKMNPPRGANLVKPAGPTDPEVSIISLQTLDGKPLAVLANYSLHYVGGVGSNHISSDYYGVFCDRLQQLLGADRQDPPFVAMMSNGTSGNINNNDYSKTPAKSGGPYSKIREVADDVAQATVAAMKGITYQDWVPLDARFSELKLEARKPTPELVTWAQGVLDKPRLIGGKTSVLEIAYAERTLKLKDAPPQIDLPLQTLRIGAVGICAIPCETFVETGLELKQKSPFKPTFTHSIASGYYGYLPTPEHHELGGYETWLGTNRLEVQASVKITARLLEMLGSMKAAE
ncbi:neutral/alkaline ceramidase-like enzyme [Prosthecobacter fusiformis]|uniref:Neutral/alkaline ceramidase-like enzyme n=1 Tax=Prosthecobacter fusiformis TaxID=48464 RepID=A0A4R7RM87_9BACT|nr:neutral/alkaline non-lysosomal ceramidase N-terminal domain-containing protein [Prosthecobacter fusiformis]TDU66474.1 neutral/alkaline ceramidase-like enzyme [Prosthecobacter fusiformis]